MQEQAESREFVDTLELDGAAFDYFQGYLLSDGRRLPEDKVLEYSSNAAIMNAFLRCWDAHVSKRAKSGKRATAAKDFWKRAAAALPRLAAPLHHSLPGSPRRLQMKFAEYVAEGYDFISGKYFNKNAGKVLTDQQVGLLGTCINSPNNVTDSKVAVFYNHYAKAYGWALITAGTVGV